MKTHSAFLSSGLAVLVCSTTLALAQPFPTKPIRIVVPFPPAGPADMIVRPVAQRWSELLGQPMIIDNRPGAGGVIGASLVAKAPADGYTLFAGSAGPVAINVSLYRNLPFDPIRDFAPVMQTVSTQIILVLHPAFAPNSVKELIAHAKARPGQINYASTGTGTSPHLAMELLKNMAGISMQHVPYKGGAAAITDLLAGRVDLMFINISSALPHVHTKKLKALAVATQKRATVMPELPTLHEAGIAGFDASTWHGILAPAGPPQAVITRLHATLAQSLRTPEVRSALLVQGAEPLEGSPQQFAAVIRADIAQWARLIKAAGITLD